MRGAAVERFDGSPSSSTGSRAMVAVPFGRSLTYRMAQGSLGARWPMSTR
jgi:hypothetical protein